MANDTNPEGLLIPLQFTLEEARATLELLERQAKQAGEKIGKGVSGGAAEGLKGLKEGMGRARETAMFFTSSLGEFGESGRTAQMAISGVAGAIMGGGGMLLALEGARVAVRLVTSYFEENKKALAEWQTHVTQLATQSKDAFDSIKASFNPVTTRSRAEGTKQIKAYMAEIATIMKEAREKGLFSDKDGGTWFGIDGEMASKKIHDLRKLIEDARKQSASVDKVETLKNDRDLAKERRALEIEQLDDEKKIRAEAAAKIADLEEKQAIYSADAIAGMRKAIEQKANADIAKLRKDKADKQFWDDFALQVRLAEQQIAAEEQYAKWRHDLIADARKADASAAELIELEFNAAMEQIRANDYEAWSAAMDRRDAKRRALDRDYAEWKLDFDRQVLEAERQIFEDSALGQLRKIGQDALQGLASDVAKQFGVITRSSAAYERAMRAAGKSSRDSADLSGAAFAKMTQDALASVAEQATVKAIFETAMGLADLAIGNAAGAGTHFASAGEFGAAAVPAGAAAYGIGQTRGMTKAERASVSSASTSTGLDSVTSSSGAREVGGGSDGGAAGIVRTREVIIIADAFDTPQETARRMVRRLELARNLNLIPAKVL